MANVTYTVPNKNGSYDGDMVVKEYSSVTINAGDTVTVDQPCRGLFLYCKGDMTINGTLSMSSRGAAANPTSSGGSDSNAVGTNGLQYGFFDGSSTDTLTMDGTTFNGCGTAVRTAISTALSGSGTGFKVHSIPRTNTNGSARPSVATSGTRENPADIRGGNGSSSGAFFGGGGAGGQAYANTYGRGGNGGDSTCFSGGAAGGGGAGGGAGGSPHNGQDANNYGGAGGDGGSHTESGGNRPKGTGGAGNPGGVDGAVGNNGLNDAGDGNGGLIILVVGGNLTIGSSGKITANGTRGGDSSGTNDNSAMGGGSGGGHILIVCKGTVTANSSTISAGQYVGNAGSTVGSAGTYGEQDYNIVAWGGRGGKNPDTTNTPVQNMYTGTTLTRQGGTGGKGLISIYSAS